MTNIKSNVKPVIERFRNKAIICLSLIVLVAGGLSAQDFDEWPPLVSDLSCDGKGNAPDNVSTYNPMLSWTFFDGDIDDAQSSYSIQVRRHDNGNVVWNLTGEPLATTTRMYGGAPLEPNIWYDWSVQVWDSGVPQASAVQTASFMILDIGLRAFDGSSNIIIATDKVDAGDPVTDSNRLRIAKNGEIYSILLCGAADHGASKLLVQTPAGGKAFKMMVPPPPAIGLGRGIVILASVAGGTPGVQSISIVNVGSDSLSGLSAGISYQGAASGWLSASLSNSTAPATLTVTPTAAVSSLTAGVYIARVSVASSLAANSPQEVKVILLLSSTVTYNGNGATGGSVPVDTDTYLPGEAVTVPGSGTLVKTGHNFDGWQIGGSGTVYTPGQTFTMGTSNVTLYARWTPQTYTVSFDASGGATPSPTSKTVTYGSTYGTLATTSRTGYTFGGWCTGPAGTGIEILSTTIVTITANQTLYAKWTPQTYTVSFDAQGGTTPSPTSKTVTYGQTYGALATTSRTGFSFGGWYTGVNGAGSQITSATTVSITASQTLYANWVVTWQATTMPADCYWWSVAYGNGLFVATAGASEGHGKGTLAATSPDGLTWTTRTMPSSELWVKVIYGGGKFVAVGYASNKGAVSTDGISWTSVTLPVTANWMSLAYGNGRYVAVAEGVNTYDTAVATSTDGITWTSGTLPEEDRWGAVAYGNGVFVAVAGYNTSSTNAATSTDGVTWTKRTLPVSGQWSYLAFGNGLFLATNMNSSIVATSPDGISWTARTMPYNTTWHTATYGECWVVLSYSHTYVATSSDGITWRTGTLPSASSWSGLAYGNGIYVTVARNTSAAAVGP